MDANRFLTHSLRDPRVTRILAAALDAVEPGNLVQNYLLDNQLPEHKRIFLLGIGKASEAMMRAAVQSLRAERGSHSTSPKGALSPKTKPPRADSSFFAHRVEAPYHAGLIITKHASGHLYENIAVIEAGHPIPNQHSIKAGETALEFVSALNEDDLLICLISGGGSALMTAPHAGIMLEDMQSLTRALLACGASIDEINLLRSKLDRVKGGGLARATKAKIVSLILSDVLGNPLEIIASGPTIQSKVLREDVMRVIKKYSLHPAPNVLDALADWQIPFNESMEHRVQNIIIADIHTAIQAALKQAQVEGFDSEIIDSNLHGEASEIGTEFAKKLKQNCIDDFSRSHAKAAAVRARPFCLIAGGETTVTLQRRSGRTGKGGRNQELALAAVDELDGIENVLLISLATDGDDGPTDAAGAVVNGETCQRGKRLGLFAAEHLSINDAYHFFQPLNDLIKCGYTGTNVNDLLFLFGF